MEQVLKGLEPEGVLTHFERISQIPRGSGNEKAVSDYIYGWAREKGLEAYQDSALNVIIKKPAAPGYEQSETVMLQAHMDMVCEKNSDSGHDFLKDPILLKLEGDLIASAGGTTLGADNGIGVAYCMAVLEAAELQHPPLEILLTTEEESTFKGANTVTADLFQANKLINLDQAEEDQILAGSCGGSGVKGTLPLEWEITPKGFSAFRLGVSGLLGGHSGEDIHRGHGTAIGLLVRALYALKGLFDIRLAEMSGGSYRLAISREAEAILLVPELMGQQVNATVKQLEETFQTEYQGVCQQLVLEWTELENSNAEVLTDTSLDKLIQFLYLFPDGIENMNGVMTGLVESSINLGVIRLGKAGLDVEAELRATFESTGQHIKNQVVLLGQVFGAEISFFAGYPSWPFHLHSPLREKTMEVFQQQFGREMKPVVIHAGIECGCLLKTMPHLDAIAIGPNCWGFHSPAERMSLSSVKRMWELLVQLLAELK
ncbi:aminoacyl-histidine dipeptidase [Aminipila butyrica]|uniref:Cytosol non-specific dipeptidase n=1 Tax=Aminipila butyrica TaxID=433296 RepID=A0A858C1P6_9FIRM|nr:beta-Ala-His dipeptidase [Aminipila butyrica]QIB70526.1 aminoacyl-histidine dipeptidase [Aminipila butyrica]